VAIVTGGSRGVGRGVALGLAEAGATVYSTSRSGAPTLERADDGPGAIVALRCAHREDAAVAAALGDVIGREGRLDVLVNNVWGGYEAMVEDGVFTWERPFWEQPLWRWDAMFQAGVRAHYVASQLAAAAMIGRRSGLIVNISSLAGREYGGNAAYGVAKAATDRLAADMAHELRPYNVAAVSLSPGLVRTERVLEFAAFLDLSDSESPLFSGRAVAALAADPAIMRKSGQVLTTAALAAEYGFRDDR